MLCPIFRHSLTTIWLGTVFCLAYAENNTCDTDFRYVIDGVIIINITESCNEIPCITKCCPKNEIFFNNETDDSISCLDVNNLTLTYNTINLDNYSEIPIYNKNVKQIAIKTTKRIENFTLIYSDSFQIKSKCSDEIVPKTFSPPEYLTYILENGNLIIRKLNDSNQGIDEILPGQFCIELQVVLNYEGALSKPQLTIRTLTDDYGDEEKETKYRVIAYGMLVSCVFLLLVLAVYLVLPELRNMAGWMLMSYVVNLFSAFMLRAVILFTTNIVSPKGSTCTWLNFIVCYTTVASFTWMNVISFDIWWSMRGFRGLRQIHRQGALVKFCWYSLYGWGAPLLPVIFMVIVEHLDLIHPNFVKPRYSVPGKCLLEEDERQLYMDIPIIITICINILLFLMTVYNIWRIKHGVSQHNVKESRKNKSDDNRFSSFGVYVKIALVMGINWILDVLSTLYHTDSVWWYIPDVFNSLIGVTIFIIFVCKRNVIVLLCKRFSIRDELVRKWQPVEFKSTNSTQGSRRKILESVTETSDIEDFGTISLSNPE